MVLAILDILQVVEQHKHDSCNLFFTVEVHHLGYLLNDCKGVVLKVWVRELMVAEDPKHAEDVVAYLVGINAASNKQLRYHFEAMFCGVLLCKIVCLQNSHQSEGVSFHVQTEGVVVLHLHKVVQELTGWLLALLEIFMLNH